MREVLPLFAIPVYETVLNPISQEIKDYIINLPYERMHVGNGWYSEEKYVLENPECEPLKKLIMEELEYFIRDTLHVRKGIDFHMTNSWAVKHEKGDWGQMHAHTNSLLSGVFYLQTNEDSGKIRFHKEINYNNLFPISTDLEYDSYNIFNSRIWTFKPKNDLLLFFPSNLMHSITDNESEEDRFSLAFNFFPKGKLGAKEFQLELR